MDVQWSHEVPRNSGYAFEVSAGQHVKIQGHTIVDFVAFNRANLRERFDQARTKANQGKIFISTGDQLISKSNNPMMTIVEDQFVEGHHDLQEGMCSRRRYELVRARGNLSETYKRPFPPEEIPDHGCWENLINALEPHGIAPEDIPSPFNLFQDMKIDGETGRMDHSRVRPKPGAYILLRAEMDLLAAFSVCPDPVVGAQPVTVSVLA